MILVPNEYAYQHTVVNTIVGMSRLTERTRFSRRLIVQFDFGTHPPGIHGVDTGGVNVPQEGTRAPVGSVVGFQGVPGVSVTRIFSTDLVPERRPAVQTVVDTGVVPNRRLVVEMNFFWQTGPVLVAVRGGTGGGVGRRGRTGGRSFPVVQSLHLNVVDQKDGILEIGPTGYKESRIVLVRSGVIFRHLQQHLERVPTVRIPTVQHSIIVQILHVRRAGAVIGGDKHHKGAVAVIASVGKRTRVERTAVGKRIVQTKSSLESPDGTNFQTTVV
mmetsp:Transcript_18955/g.28829  ORF Transcript_18955/g.28829 Transcript_18955/m.28829 type:complete len:273 (-) Transcript_18955:209-1027(-)